MYKHCQTKVGNMQIKWAIILALGIVLASFAGITISVDDGVGSYTRADPGKGYGEDLVENFQNQSMIDTLESSKFTIQGITPYVEPYADFNNYSDEQNIIGDNGFAYHTTMNAGTFTAEMASMFGSTSMIAEQRCADPSISSFVLTKDFSLSKGIVQIGVCPIMVDPTDHLTTQIELLGTDSLSSSASERLMMVGFNYGGIYCYDGAYKPVMSSASSKTWYTITIEFDCSLKQATITASHGSDEETQTCGFQNDFGKLRRICLKTGKNVAGNQLVSYWDNLCVVTEFPDSYMI